MLFPGCSWWFPRLSVTNPSATRLNVRFLMKAFIESLFCYCPLIWRCHNRAVNNKINYLHEELLRTIYKDNTSSFEDLLKRDKSFTVHQRNIQLRTTELFKVEGNLSSNIMYDIFQTRKIDHNLRSQNDKQIWSKFADILCFMVPLH